MVLHEIKKPLHIKDKNYQNQETMYRMRENLCQLLTGEKINIQIYKELQKLNTKSTNNPINK
jgi:ribosome biogenesis GTPase A